MAGMGGFGGRARPHRRVSARFSRAAHAPRLRLLAIWPLRRRLRARADRLRPLLASRHRELQGVHDRGGRPRRRLRRHVVGRARRRASARGLAAEDVRRGARRGIPRVQGALGPRRPHEPGQDRRPLSARLEPALRRGLPRAGGGNRVRVSRHPQRLRRRRAAVRRRRQVPARDQGHDVPELHGDARGAALDARPSAAARRNGARPPTPALPAQRRLAQQGRARRARSLPRLQGLPRRMPGQRRHRHVQGRVQPSLLPGQAPAALRVFDGTHPLVEPRRFARAERRERARASSAAPLAREARGGRRARAHNAALRRAPLYPHALAPSRGTARAASRALARHIQQLLRARQPRRRRRGARGDGLSARAAERARCAARGRSMRGECSISRSGSSKN